MYHNKFFLLPWNAHSWWCLAHSIHTKILIARFSSTPVCSYLISGEETEFWEADLLVNMGPWALSLSLVLVPFGVSGDNGSGKEMALLLGPVKIGGADTQQDRCSVLLTGEVWGGLRCLAYIHLCTWGDKWKTMTKIVQHHSCGRNVGSGEGSPISSLKMRLQLIAALNECLLLAASLWQ